MVAAYRDIVVIQDFLEISNCVELRVGEELHSASINADRLWHGDSSSLGFVCDAWRPTVYVRPIALLASRETTRLWLRKHQIAS